MVNLSLFIPFDVQVYPLKELYFSSTSNMDQYQIAYAEKLIEYNKEVLNGKTKLDLMSKFMSVASPHDQVRFLLLFTTFIIVTYL